MEIRPYSDIDRDAWLNFIESRPEAWMYHLPGWKEVVERAYGHDTFYLAAVEDESVRGILPMVMIKSRIFGRSLTSMPYVDSAGIVAADDFAREALLSRAAGLAAENSLDFVELRQTTEIPGDLKTDTHKVTLALDLPEDQEALWKSLPSERRNRIRKAEKADLAVEIAGRKKLDTFYRIWSANMRDLGSPAHSIAFFDQILRVFPEHANILLVSYRAQYIGAAVALHFKDTLTLPWVSSLRKYFDLYPNNILYWEAMRYAVEKGCRHFDFGRSSINSGTYTFKIRWGAKPRQLFWQFRSVAGAEPGISGADNPKYSLAISIWKRLPVGLTRLIGPPIRKYITA